MAFLILGIVFFITGIFFLFRPEIMLKVDKWGEKVIFDDKKTVKRHIKTGVFFIMAAILMLVFAHLVDKWDLSEFFKRLLL